MLNALLRRFLVVFSATCALACSSTDGPGPTTGQQEPVTDASTADGVTADVSAADVVLVDGCAGQPDGAPCQDGDACTVGDTCQADACVGGEANPCDAEGPCRLGVCDSATGCAYEDAPDGDACEVPCFETASCSAGQCATEPASAVVCEAPDSPCVESIACDPATGECTLQTVRDEGFECDTDSNVCTLEACDTEGVCAPAGYETCETEGAADQCAAWSCVAASGCVKTFLAGAGCDDGDACTQADTCTETPAGDQLCLGQGLPTDDGNACTEDVCAGGQVSNTPVEGAACDQEACAVPGVCTAQGECVAASICDCVDCSDQEGTCFQATCNPDTGACDLPQPQDWACDDEDAGTSDDVCDGAGECAGTAIACVPAQCEASSTPDGAACVVENKAAGVACDDGDPNTHVDVCDGKGSCAGATYECVPGTCEASSTPNGSGCDVAFASQGAGCDDGDSGTKSDSCDGLGQCAGEAYACAAGQCEAASTPDGAGCVPTWMAAGVACDDGDAATKVDVCDGVGGCGGTEYVCTPGVCEASSAPNGTDCTPIFAAPGTACDDGVSGTKGDVCNGAGTCVGTPYSCTPGVCEAAGKPNGEGCDVQYLAAGVACDDGDVSTKVDVCDGKGGCAGGPYACVPGSCEAASTPDGQGCVVQYSAAGVGCDDGDPGTKIDVCDGTGGCAGTPYSCTPAQCEASSKPDGAGCAVTYKQSGAPCDDQNPESKSDICDGQGACGGKAYECNPKTCEASSTPDGVGCVVTYVAAGVACDDTVANTKVDVCDGQGGCAGTPYACTPGLCQSASSPDGTGCTPIYDSAGTGCDDGAATTKDDQCDGSGGCAGTPYTCTPGQCDASSVPDGSGCVVRPLVAGAGCDDTAASTKGDQCNGQGGCAGTPYSCTPGLCEASSTPNGVGCTPVFSAQGTSCDDGVASTKSDVCDGGGGCAGTPYGCTPGQCDATSTPDGSGCVTTPKAAGATCDDGANTTKSDQCDGQGGCAGTPYTCTPGTCEVSSAPNGVGCTPVFEAQGVTCDDTLAGTKSDVCDGFGVCAGTPYSCSPGTCEASSTPNGTDCTVVFSPSGTACDDGNAGTQADKCDGAGGCAGVTNPCQDGTPVPTGGCAWTSAGNDTFVVPGGVTSINVTLIGGGGGGGDGFYYPGGGGGSGFYKVNQALSVSPGQSISITVGGGGNAQASGGATSFGSVSASGGNPGKNHSIGRGQASAKGGNGGSGGAAGYTNSSDGGGQGSGISLGTLAGAGGIGSPGQNNHAFTGVGFGSGGGGDAGTSGYNSGCAGKGGTNGSNGGTTGGCGGGGGGAGGLLIPGLSSPGSQKATQGRSGAVWITF